MNYAIPLAEAFIDKLLPFWAAIFGEALPDISAPFSWAVKSPIARAHSMCNGKAIK